MVERQRRRHLVRDAVHTRASPETRPQEMASTRWRSIIIARHLRLTAPEIHFWLSPSLALHGSSSEPASFALKTLPDMGALLATAP